jgi:membrane-associated protein
MQSPSEFIARWHYAGLFAIILVEEAGIPLPVPGDLFIAAMGALAYQGRASFLPTVAVVTVATVIGATGLYLVSRHAGRPTIVKVARRFGYTEAREARLEAWLLRRGALAVVVGRHVPGLRIVMTVVAGALRLPQPTFVFGTLVAGMLWATIYFWFGYGLGAGWQRASTWLPTETLVVMGVAAAAAVALALIVWRWHRRSRLAAAAREDPRP